MADNYEDITLDDFISQSDTVDFTFPNSYRFRKYISDKPYIKVGTELSAGDFLIVYTKERYIDKIFYELGSNFISFYPQLLTPLSMEANNAAGITVLQQQRGLNLTGKGVILGFIDTGIDYQNRSFIYEDGTSKIKYIWDQTIDGNPPEKMRFGSVYDQMKLSEALQSSDPLSIVPTVDAIGHGTFLASVAGGREKNEYIGAAPDSEIIAVKLKPANTFLQKTYHREGLSYSSSDFLLGAKFILDKAGEMNRPVVICVGLGTNFGGHDGNTLIEKYLSIVGQRIGLASVAAAGNESSAAHHASGRIERSGDSDIISFAVNGKVDNIPIYLWSAAYDKLSVEIISPLSETTNRVPVHYNKEYRKKFVMEDSTVLIRYYKDTGDVAIINIENPTPGVWNIKLYGDSIVVGQYNAWLPVADELTKDVTFMSPSPQNTIVIPATASNIITVGAYNSMDNSLFRQSSWGPTRDNRLAPTFVAPGVDIQGAYPAGYGSMTGTSVSAAVAAGACALMFQWGIENRNDIALDQERLKALLISGCERDQQISYPNEQWGFGKLNVLGVFKYLQELSKL